MGLHLHFRITRHMDVFFSPAEVQKESSYVLVHRRVGTNNVFFTLGESKPFIVVTVINQVLINGIIIESHLI